MLQIRLSTVASSEGGTAPKPGPADSVTVACPDHLVLADLPVAKGLGSATSSALVKNVGRRVRRHLHERVHFCVRCDFPIIIYGRLSPCEHVFCLDCSRSDSICYLCEERIQKIQTLKFMEGIYICAAPHCLLSFLKKPDLDTHIIKNHSDLLQQHTIRNMVNESEAVSAKQSTASESTARAPPKTPFSPNSTSQVNDSDDKSRVLRDQQPPQQQPPPPPVRPIMQPIPFPAQYFAQFQNHPSDAQTGHNSPQVFPPNFQPFNYPQFQMDGSQPSDQGALLGFPQPWNMMQSFPNMLDSQGRAVFFEGGNNYRPNMTILPVNMANPSTSMGTDVEDKGIMVAQPLPPMPPNRFSQPKQEE